VHLVGYLIRNNRSAGQGIINPSQGIRHSFLDEK